MKCPKCGSENIIRYEKGINIDTCEDCETIIQFYQARLDKVLSKLEQIRINGTLHLASKLSDDTRLLCMYNSEFYITNEYYDYHNTPQYSLDTVEHLLNDIKG